MMPRSGYARLSNGLWLNDKINDLIDANPHAFAMWTLAISYCSDELNDGVLSRRALRRIGADESDVADLVAFGLLDECDDGSGSYRIHDYLKHQNSRDDVERDKEAARERMRRRRSKRSGEPETNEEDTEAEPDENRSEDVRPNNGRTNAERSKTVRKKCLGLNQNQNQESSNEDSLPQTPSRPRDESGPDRPGGGNAYTAEFEQFWTAYPRHEGKRRAFDAWRHARRKTGHEHLLAMADRYAKDPNREPRYTLTPANWLDGEHWLDDPQPPRRPTGPRASPDPDAKSRSQRNLEANMANTWKYMTPAERAEYQRKNGEQHVDQR
ncbi:hypothetical protein [Bifidobacterium catulorum]|uniref:DUF1376 domain-containing protein n=1 Tax=Bifidobacterium catulorum TaxID=1630173 RepID=A0A2U2MUE4_9BIFI|nr:hypothetical protein [Bifidobacterium catulorum]PWG60481.1 hypothetical protein DF200_02475 [Bifidobacterium catulorum]